MAAYLGLSGNTNTQAIVKYGALQVGVSQYDIPIPVFWGQRRLNYNCVWYNGFVAHPDNPKGKGGSSKGEQNYTYTAAVILAMCEGVVDDILNVWSGGSTTNTTTLARLNITSFEPGSATQPPQSWIVTNYPAQALSYALTAYLFSPKFALGSTPSVPDNAFECVRLNGFTDTLTTDGWTNPITEANTPGVDCCLADILPDFLTSVQYGMGFESGDLPDLTDFRAYQNAQGLFFSPYLVNQEKATDIIDRWAGFANCWIYWSGTSFVIVPLGDSAISANGYSWSPDLSAACNLGTGDFPGNVPLKVTVASIWDARNRTRLEFADRTLCYSTNVVEYTDTTLRDEIGLRDDSSTQADEICAPQVAAVVVQLLGKRNAWIRRTASFKTSYRFIRILPGTIVTLSDPNIGIDALAFRIQTVSEDKDGTLNFTAEELVQGTGTYEAIAADPPSGGTASGFPDENVDPGNINTPGIVEPSSDYTGGQAVVVLCASGNPDTWGGCNVHVSFDGADYTEIGAITSPAIQGVLTANLASYGGANPDTTDTLSVDLTESAGVPAPVTNADAQNLRTLSLIAAQPTSSGGFEVVPSNGELLAFGAVATTGAYTANLTYLYRGVEGTSGSAHSTGDQFTLLDVSGSKGTSVVYRLPARYIGQTLYFKFASFNAFGQATQDLSSVAAYQYTPTGAGYGAGAGGVPGAPTGLSASAGVQSVALSWNANPATDNVTAYKIYRAPGAGASFGSGSLIATVNALYYLDTALGVSAGYTYFLEAVNSVGASSPTSGVNATTSATAIGSVTSVALTMPAEFAVSGSPITGAGTLAVSKANESANLVYAGPSSGGAAVPIFRTLVASDLPVATASAFGAVKPDNSTITISGGVITSIAGGATGANPTATAGPVAINGSATTFMRSDAAPAVQKCSASQFGLCEVDGTTITASGGVITATGFAPASTPFHPGYISGRWYYPPTATPSFGAQNITQNTIYATPFYVAATTTFKAIGLLLDGNASGKFVELGIYANNGGVPGALILDAGQVSVSVNQPVTITISQTLAAGWYWLACAHNNTTVLGVFVTITGIAFLTGNTSFVSSGVTQVPTVSWSFSTGSLPNPFGTPTWVSLSNGAPVMALQAI